MSKRKSFSILLIIVLMFTLVLTACGSSETPEQDVVEDEPTDVEEQAPEADDSNDEATDEDAQSDEDSEADVNFNNLKNIDNLDSLTNLFSSLDYQWNYGENNFSKVMYSAKVQETINGVETTKINIIIENNETTEEMNFWVDGDGNTVKALMNGQEIPGEMFRNMADAIINSIFWPFTLAENYTAGPAFDKEAEDIEGYKATIQNMGKNSLNGKDYTHYVTNIQIGPPYSEEEIKYVWQIGDFGDFQLLLNWETENAPADAEMKFEVIDFELK